MKIMLLVVAASLAVPALPAAAQELDLQSFQPREQPRFDRDFRRDHRRDGKADHRHRHRRGATVVIGDLGWNDAWALYNNRTFEPDSYNDWWHDRPDRAYPRWIRSNMNCERLWWSGGGWRC